MRSIPTSMIAHNINVHGDVPAVTDGIYFIKVDKQLTADEIPLDGHTSVPPVEPARFLSLANLRIAQMSLLCGTVYGYSIGFIGTYIFLYGAATDCSLYHRETPCVTLSNAKCAWMPGTPGSYCGWAAGVTCGKTYFTEVTCQTDEGCRWSYSANECNNPTGLSAGDTGIFAASAVLGNMVGSLCGPLIKRLGFKPTFVLCGLAAVVMSSLHHVAVAKSQFWLLNVARFMLGVPLGLACVAGPMYIGQRAAPRYASMLGMSFQISTCIGQLLAALIGLAVGQSIRYDAQVDQRIVSRIQGLCAPSTVISAIVVVAGLFLDGFGFRDRKTSSSSRYRESSADVDAVPAEEQPVARQYTIREMVPLLLMGIVVSGAVQLVGINAVMNFAPTIMRSFGLAPMVGNTVVMLWNFIMPIVSIPLAARIDMRRMFLFGTIATGCSCLFLCGIPVYPGVTDSDSTRNGVAIFGILLFIAAFQIFVGPMFYIVMFDLFPPSFAARGASFTLSVKFAFTIVVTASYSSAVETFSGGPSGDQHQGQAIVFVSYGVIGIVCFILEYFYMHAWVDPAAGDGTGSLSINPPVEMSAKHPQDTANGVTGACD